jgi:hypothetical protein
MSACASIAPSIEQPIRARLLRFQTATNKLPELVKPDVSALAKRQLR